MSAPPEQQGAAGPSSGPASTAADDSGNDKRKERENSPPQKRQKFSRSRTACYQCRSRKSKCGAVPPDPCPNCIEADLPCQWPTEDGRSSKARLQRYRNQQAPRGLTGVIARDMADMKPDLTAPEYLGEGWLDRLLAGGDPGTSRGTGPFDTPVGFASDFMSPGAVMQQQRFPFTPMPAPDGFTPNPQGQTQAMLPGTQTPGSFFGQLAQQPAVDPAQFVWAVSSRLPTVEDASPNDERSVSSDPSPADPALRAARRSIGKKDEGKLVKVSWWRPHGQTAIAPGLKKITLKVRVNTPQDTWSSNSPQVTVGAPGETQEVIAPDGAPSTVIMRHLLDVFMTHSGCQYPFIDRADLEAKIENRTASVFLLLCIAAIAARFSTHPAIALPDLQPYEYGNVFYARAKSMLGSMLGIPSREAIGGFVLLASLGFANDSESEVWMMTGLAARMSIDAGLHLSPPEDSPMSAEDRRLNKLVFWSVLLMDYALAFGVGRQTTFRPEDITQTLPTEEDLNHSATPAAVDTPRSPFPYAAKMMLSYGPLINLLNRGRGDRDIHAPRAAAIKLYNSLPQDMQWNVVNLQRHSRNNQGSIFLHLHLWMHTILASEFLTGSNLLRRTGDKPVQTGAATPSAAAAASLWRNSVRTIGDILVLSDIINPYAYFALPFVNQAWFVAGCCYVKGRYSSGSDLTAEIELHATGQSRPVSRAASPIPSGLPMNSGGAAEGSVAAGTKAAEDAPTLAAAVETTEKDEEDKSDSDASTTSTQLPRPVDLSRALLTSVATTNISTLQQGLSKLAKYWYGAEWIAGALGQRVKGIWDVDLVRVRENFASFVSLPDAGALRSGAGPGELLEEGEGEGEGMGGIGGLGGFGDMGELDFLSLPFDLGAGVTEQEVPIPVFPPNWGR